MKRITLVSVAMLMACMIYGQDHERKYLVYANGAYSQYKTDPYYGTTGFSTELKGGKISVGMYRKVNNFLYAGIGLGYQERNEYKHIDIDNFTNLSNNSAFFSDHTKSEESKITPTINFNFYKNLTDRFYIGLNVLTGYGFTKKIDEYFALIVVNNPDYFLSSYNNTSYKQGIYFSIQPELIYYVSNWMGISAQFNFFTFDSINASQLFFATNSNDIMWSLGIVFPIN
jgi:hypothetical protein